jgi:hypothetical protein
MKIFNNFLRRWFPKQYCLRGLKRTEEHHKKLLKAAAPQEKYDLKSELDSDIWEWLDWLTEIEDAELIAKAAKMDIYLDEIPLPPLEPGEDRPNHYRIGNFGNRLLCKESREALVRKVRERAATYRKERREIVELYIKVAAIIITGITGLLGAATGLVALLKK